jgi:tyrosine-protein kinase Etk/Wzc
MSLNRKNNDEKSTNILGKIIFLYVPYWPVFLVLFCFFGLAAWLYLKYTTPIYETTARILINDERKGAEEPKSLETFNKLSGKTIVENEMEVFKSKSLLLEVVNHLKLYAPVSQEKSFKTISVYASSPITIEARDLRNITEVKKVPFRYDQNKSAIVIGRNSYPLDEFVSTEYGKLRFTRNNHYYGGTNSGLFFSLVSPKEIADNLEAGLAVTSVSKLSSILQLTYKDEVPERAEDILNDLLTSYTNATITDKNALATNTLNFINDRLKYVRQDLDGIEHRIQQYKSKKGAVDLSTQGRLFLENVSSNDQKLSEINMQLAVLDQVEQYVISKDQGSGIVPSTLGVTDPTLSSLVTKLYNTELEYESLKKTTADNNPVLVSVNDQIQKIKPSILENIRSQRRSLTASRNNLSATNGSYSSILQTMPETERQLIDINREQGTKNEIYNFLLQKREEAALANASIVSESRIIDKAQSSDKPVSPKKKVVYLSSILLALFTGIGIVLGKETLSRKIMFRHEIEQFTDKQIIGEITVESSKNPIVVGEGKRTFIAEQFRKIRASLPYLGVNTVNKKILVTSSISGEGKSFVATNLALSLAITGKKVVLLDFDLNNPSLNNKLNIKQGKGITEYLLGEVAVDDIIKPTDLHKNLLIVPTGKLPENPSELITSGKVDELLATLETSFDYIVIDTAPVGPVTDAYLLSPFCNATLFIVRHGYTPKALVARIDANNTINKLHNMAIIFNGVNSRGFGNKYYGYGYGYGDVYGYIDDSKKNRKLLPISKN